LSDAEKVVIGLILNRGAGEHKQEAL
jgi:hypothetical protein